MISVIISTYNRCESLKDTLNSLLTQECDGSFDYEIIVVDNNSKDKTKEVVGNYKQKFNGRLKYLFEPRQGKSFALNTAIQEAKGEIIAFTDDDCITPENWLLNAWNEMQNNSPVDLILGDYCFIGQEIKKDRKFDNLLCGRGLNMIVNRNTFEKYGGFDPLLGPGTFVTTSEDVDISYRIIRNDGIVKLSNKFIVYHVPRLFTNNYLKQIYQQTRGVVIFWNKYLVLEGDLSSIFKIYTLFKKKIKNVLISYKERNFTNVKIHLFGIVGYLSGILIGPLYWSYLKLNFKNNKK